MNTALPKKSSWPVRLVRGAWRALDATRRALLNLLFLVILIAIVWMLVRGGSLPALQPKTTLVIDLAGVLVEQRAGTNLRATAMRQLGDNDDEEPAQTRLRDVLAVIDAAAKDGNVTQALLLSDNLAGGGMAKLHEVAAAISRFKAAGKPVFAWGGSYDQRQFYLAAHATEVWLHPMGTVFVDGFGGQRTYYKDLFDRIGVTANVIRVGKFKNAAEAFAASGPSPETLESDGALYGSLWASYTAAVEGARKLPAGSVAQAIESLPQSFKDTGGDAARWAQQRKWVDQLKTRDEMRAMLMERGAKTDDGKTFRQVNLAEYLPRVKPAAGDGVVGVIVAQGNIGDGRAGPGSIGGLSTSELIRRARDDKAVKAVVLRVDSPGGSAFGSELIRRELELTRQAGKPVVVSMGDLAASGGYWISLAADEMIADEATITGSIGVIAVLPSARGALEKWGVHTGGTGTTWLKNAYDVRSGMDPRFAELLQASIGHVYGDFVARAAAARKSTPEKIDAIAQGRVWAGKDAQARGLVDRLGSLDDALKAAASRAKLADGWRVQYIEAEPGRLAQLLQGLGLAFTWDPAAFAWQRLLPDGAAALALPGAAGVAGDLAWFAGVAAAGKPLAAQVHCLCTALP